MATIVPGKRINERYEIIGQIAQGGMATIWLAQDLLKTAENSEIKHHVAVKVPLRALYYTPKVAERFAREMEVLKRLDHPNICRIFDVGTTEEGLPFFVMPNLQGQNLKQMMRGGLDPKTSILLIIQTLSGLQHAHELGVVHRDIKPSNLFVTNAPRGGPRVKLIDFGISKMLDPDDDSSESLTLSGATLGTSFYMAPEQLVDARNVDNRADIYSLGIVLYELLVGFHPLKPHRQRSDKSPRTLGGVGPLQKYNRHIPAALDKAIMRALTIEKESRYSFAVEFAEALAKISPEEVLEVAKGIERENLTETPVDAPEEARRLLRSTVRLK